MKIPCKQIEVQVYISDITCKFIDCYVSIGMKPMFLKVRHTTYKIKNKYYKESILFGINIQCSIALLHLIKEFAFEKSICKYSFIALFDFMRKKFLNILISNPIKQHSKY